MKNRISILAAFLFFLITACDKETVVKEDALPQSIKEYVATHFPNNAIVQIVKDKEVFNTSYELTLEGSYLLEFDKKNEVKEVKGINPIPDSTVPAAILEYVKENYPEAAILQWEKDDHDQEVQLDNHIELVFSLSGDFLRIDI